jgi:hypothetical protein
VAQLESGQEPPSELSRGALLVSGAVLALCAAAFVTAVVGLGGVSAALGMSDAHMNWAGSGLVMSLGCSAPLAMGGWLAWRWYSA